MSCKSWTYPETQALLDIWQQDHIQTQLTLMARNRPVWEQVAEIMKYRKGFNRTGEQCKTRIHTLKIRYNRAKKFGLSGPEAEKECPFYKQLDAVLGKNWVKKDLHKHLSPPSSLSPTSSITSLYPLTFANDLDKIHHHPGMIQILPKPIPKYVDTAFTKITNNVLKVPDDKIDDMLGEHTKIIKKMITGLSKKENGEELYFGETDNLEEVIKSLLCTPVCAAGNIPAPCIPHSKTAFTSPGSPVLLTPQSQDGSPVTTVSSSNIHCNHGNTHSIHEDGSPDQPHNKRRKLADDQDKISDRLVMLSAMTQIINNVNELTKNVKQVQELEDKKIESFIQFQEQRLEHEKEHYKNMELLLTSLVSAIKKEKAEYSSVKAELLSE